MNPTDYTPFDGDYIEADYAKFFSDIQMKQILISENTLRFAPHWKRIILSVYLGRTSIRMNGFGIEVFLFRKVGIWSK